MNGHRTYTCCREGCAHVICFTPEVEQRLRKTHEFWTCPAGHKQHFAGKTPEEERIDQLEREVARLRNRVRSLLRVLSRRNTCWCGSSFETHKQLRGHRMGASHWAVDGEAA